jgi:hypothetical protein
MLRAFAKWVRQARTSKSLQTCQSRHVSLAHCPCLTAQADATSAGTPCNGFVKYTIECGIMRVHRTRLQLPQDLRTLAF